MGNKNHPYCAGYDICVQGGPATTTPSPYNQGNNNWYSTTQAPNNPKYLGSPPSQLYDWCVRGTDPYRCQETCKPAWDFGCFSNNKNHPYCAGYDICVQGGPATTTPSPYNQGNNNWYSTTQAPNNPKYLGSPPSQLYDWCVRG